MAKESFFNKFAQPQNYLHYVMLTLGLFLWHAIPYTTVVETTGTFFDMFVWYLLGLFVLDSIVHAIFWYLPEPYQWRD